MPPTKKRYSVFAFQGTIKRAICSCHSCFIVFLGGPLTLDHDIKPSPPHILCTPDPPDIHKLQLDGVYLSTRAHTHASPSCLALCSCKWWTQRDFFWRTGGERARCCEGMYLNILWRPSCWHQWTHGTHCQKFVFYRIMRRGSKTNHTFLPLTEGLPRRRSVILV